MVVDRITNLEDQNQLLLKYTEFLFKKYESSQDFESESNEINFFSPVLDTIFQLVSFYL